LRRKYAVDVNLNERQLSGNISLGLERPTLARETGIGLNVPNKNFWKITSI